MSKHLAQRGASRMAERGGFEPPRPFWGLHDFESCAFDHSATSPKVVAAYRFPFKVARVVYSLLHKALMQLRATLSV